MTKKVLALVVASLTIGGFSVFAQNDNKQEKCNAPTECCQKKDAKKKSSKHNTLNGIDLTADQQAAIDKLNDERFEKIKATKAASRNAIKEEREAYHQALKQILTPDQYQKYEENCKNLQAKKDKKKDKKREGKGDKGNRR